MSSCSAALPAAVHLNCATASCNDAAPSDGPEASRLKSGGRTPACVARKSCRQGPGPTGKGASSSSASRRPVGKHSSLDRRPKRLLPSYIRFMHSFRRAVWDNRSKSVLASSSRHTSSTTLPHACRTTLHIIHSVGTDIMHSVRGEITTGTAPCQKLITCLHHSRFPFARHTLATAPPDTMTTQLRLHTTRVLTRHCSLHTRTTCSNIQNHTIHADPTHTIHHTASRVSGLQNLQSL